MWVGLYGAVFYQELHLLVERGSHRWRRLSQQDVQRLRRRQTHERVTALWSSTTFAVRTVYQTVVVIVQVVAAAGFQGLGTVIAGPSGFAATGPSCVTVTGLLVADALTVLRTRAVSRAAIDAALVTRETGIADAGAVQTLAVFVTLGITHVLLASVTSPSRVTDTAGIATLAMLAAIFATTASFGTSHCHHACRRVRGRAVSGFFREL